MNIVLYRWGAYTEPDLIYELEKLGNKLDVLIYKLDDKHCDEGFEKELSCKLHRDVDMVFSVNYFPVIAKVCHANNIKYVSWSYDAPLNVTNIEETLGYTCNYVFMFDRDQVIKYKNKGFSNVHHMPLAVPVERYNRIRNLRQGQFFSDISFVGNLYSDMLNVYLAPLDDYMKGFIKGLCASQGQLYGCYILDEIIDDKIIDKINDRYKEINPNTEIVMSKEALTYAMASAVTREERLKILGILSAHHKLRYYSKEKCDVLKYASYCGTCDYYNEMPQIFAGSRINLNITLKSLTSGIPLRALDIMGCGGFLVSNYQPELAEYFENESEMIMYDSIEDAYAKVDYYLRHGDDLERISNNGHKKVIEHFDYKQRLIDIFKIVNGEV